MLVLASKKYPTLETPGSFYFLNKGSLLAILKGLCGMVSSFFPGLLEQIQGKWSTLGHISSHKEVIWLMQTVDGPNGFQPSMCGEAWKPFENNV